MVRAQRDHAIPSITGYQELPIDGFADGAGVDDVEYIMTQEDDEPDGADDRRLRF